MSAFRDAWDTLRAVAGLTDKVAQLSDDLREMRMENRELRTENRDMSERLIRIETIIDEARHGASISRSPRRLPNG